MADKKISEFPIFSGKQDDDTFYIIASGDAENNKAQNYKISFTGLADEVFKTYPEYISGATGAFAESLTISGLPVLTGFDIDGGSSIIAGTTEEISFGGTDPSDTREVSFQQGGETKLAINEDGDVEISQSLNITESANIAGGLTVQEGSTTILNGPTKINDTLTVDDGVSTLLGGALTVTDITRIDGATTINNTLTVEDGSSTTLGGTLTVKDGATLSKTLSVADATTLKSTLTVEDGNKTTLGGELTVKEKGSFAKNVSVGTDLSVGGELTVGGTTLTNLLAGVSIDSLEDIEDVTLTSIADGDILKWDGSKWVNVDALGDITTALAGKANSSHALSSHSDVSTTSASSGQVLKWNGSEWAPAADDAGLSSVEWSQVSNKPATFDPVSHTHAISDITNLSTQLDSKASSSHTHAISEITDLSTQLDSKASSSHTHAISEITDLSTQLAAKANSSHTHSWGDISGGDFNSLSNFNTTIKFDISDYLAVSDSGGNNVRKITVEDLIQLHNAEKTKEQLDASDTDEQTLLDPTEAIEVDPDEGGGVQVEFDAVEGRCVLANDPPLTLSNFKQLIDPFGGLKLNPTYGTPDGNGCRSYSYTIAVDDSGSAATEYTLLLGKHDDIDIKGSSTPVSVRGHALHGRDPSDNDGGFGTEGKVFDASATDTSFVTNLVSAENDIYKDRPLEINGQVRTISSYNGTTKVVTLSSALTSAPSNDTAFTIKNTMSYHGLLDPNVNTNFIFMGYKPQNDTGLGTAITSFDDNSWKPSGTQTNVYVDNGYVERDTIKAKEFFEYSPTPVKRRSDDGEFAPWMVAQAHNSSTAYKRLSLVTSGGVWYLATRYVPANTSISNTIYWQVRDGNRPWDFNRIVKHNGNYYIAKNPGGAGTDHTNTTDWHQLTTDQLNNPVLDVPCNNRAEAVFYNRHNSGFAFKSSPDSNVVAQPFISWQGIRTYINVFLSNASKITVLVRDPNLPTDHYADYSYVDQKNGGGSLMIHGGVYIGNPQCIFSFCSPIIKKPRKYKIDLSAQTSTGIQTPGFSRGNMHIFLWFTGPGHSHTTLSNIYFKIYGQNEGASDGHGSFNFMRVDTGTSGDISGVTYDLTEAATSASNYFTAITLYGGTTGMWNLNNSSAYTAYRTLGPDGTFSWQKTMTFDTAAGADAGTTSSYALAELEGACGFSSEVHGNQYIRFRFLELTNGCEGFRIFHWNTANYSHFTSNGFRFSPITANSSTRLFGDFGSYVFAVNASNGTTLYHATPAAVLSSTTQALDEIGDGSQYFIWLAANKTWAYLPVMDGPNTSANYYNNNMGEMSGTSKAYWPSAPTRTGTSYAAFTTDVTLYKDSATTTSTTLTTYFTGAPMLTNQTLINIGAKAFAIGNDGLFLGDAGGAAAGNITNVVSGTSIVPTVSSNFLDNSAIVAQSLSDNIVIATTNVTALSSKSYTVS
jgi:hypothetical protein